MAFGRDVDGGNLVSVKLGETPEMFGISVESFVGVIDAKQSTYAFHVHSLGGAESPLILTVHDLTSTKLQIS